MYDLNDDSFDSFFSKMFWFETDDSQSLSLWESNLDGLDQKRLLSKVIPKSCTIDYDTSTIYWIQSDQVSYR